MFGFVTGTFVAREEVLRFGLSPEEALLLVDQIPHNEVQFSRQPYQVSESDARGLKVLHVVPNAATGQVRFKLDFEVDGIGGQPPWSDKSQSVMTSSITTPMEVVAQLGEYLVLKNLIESTVPELVGWRYTMNIAAQNNEVLPSSNKSNQYPRASGGNDVPF